MSLSINKECISLFRKLFNGRQDIFAIRKKEYTSSNGKKISSPYFPVIDSKNESYYLEHSENIPYVPLDDFFIEKYLKGEIEIMVYLIKLDRTLNFAAIDFDNQHLFKEDVLRTVNFIRQMGIKCHIARSTKKGHHVYIFFNNSIDHNYCSSFFHYILEKLNFKDEQRNNIRRLPEIFPRAIRNINSITTLGHGIKPPFWGQGLALENKRNAFVNDDDVPFQDQWKIAASIDLNGRQDSEKFIELCNSTPSIKEILNKFRETQNSILNKNENNIISPSINPYSPPPKGTSFNKILTQCEAMKSIWEKKGNVVTHEERVAMLASAIHCEDGLDIIRKRWESVETERQIRYAKKTNQSPWSCKTMQSYGFCKSDCGLKKRPPTAIKNGKISINPDNLPESQWPDPSNYRLSFSLNEKDVESIKMEIDKLKEKSGVELEQSLESILEKINEYKDKKKNSYLELNEYLKNKKFIKKGDLKKIYSDNYEKNVSTDVIEKKLIPFQDCFIGESEFAYFEENIDKKGSIKRSYFTDFKIIFEENILVVSDDITSPILNEYIGRVKFKDKCFPIKLRSDEIDDKKLFMKRFRDSCGLYSSVINSSNHQKIICAASNFGAKLMQKRVKSTIHGMRVNEKNTPEFYKSQDLTITADKIFRDKNNIIDFSVTGESNARYLRLINGDDNEFYEIASFIVKEVLRTHKKSVTYTCFAHSMQAFIHSSLIPIKEKPILWLIGLTGNGKSFLTDIYASFHGESSLLAHTCNSTINSLFKASSDFKDALLVIDDYKSQDPKGMLNLIQTIFDGKSRTSLKQNGESRAPVKSNCLAMVSAEDLLTSESSALARQILLKVSRNPNLKDDEINDLVISIKGKLNKFPIFSTRFIQYTLNLDKNEIEQSFKVIYHKLLSKVQNDAQNRERIAKNLAANIVSFNMITNFLVEYEIINEDKKHEMDKEHLENLSHIFMTMISHCKEEQASNVFLDTIKELISSENYYIEGFNTEYPQSQNKYAKKIGFVREKNINIFPKYAIDSVKQLLNKRGEGINHTTNTIGEQLKNDGFLSKYDDNRTQTKVSINGSSVWVWSIDKNKFLSN